MEYSTSSMTTQATNIVSNHNNKQQNMTGNMHTEISKKISFANKMKFQNTITIYLLSFYSGLSFITNLTLSLFLKDNLHFQPYQMAYIRLMMSLPWILRPLYGILSDLIPVCGLKRKSYIILLWLISTMSWLCLAHFSNHILVVYFTVILNQFSLAFLAVVNRAIIIETSKLYEDIDEKINDYTSKGSITQILGKFVASLFEGVLAGKMETKYVFLISSFLSILILIGGIIFIEKHPGINKKELFYSFISTSSGNDFERGSNTILLSSDCENQKDDDNKKLSIKALFQDFICNSKVYPALLFIILYNSVPSTQSSVFYFSTNKLKLSPIDMGYISILTNISMIISMIVYKKFLQQFTWLQMLIGTTFVNLICGFPYILINFNLGSLIGMDDYTLLIISRCFSAVIEQYTFTPFLCFASMITPKTFLATGTAIVTTCWNIGLTFSEATCGFVSLMLGITATNFDNFYLLIFIERFGKIFSLIILLWVNVIVPKKRRTQGRNIYQEGKLTVY